MMMMLWSQVELTIRLPADVDPQTCSRRRRLELLNSRHRRYDGARSSDLTDFSQLSTKRSWRPQNVSCWFFLIHHNSRSDLRCIIGLTWMKRATLFIYFFHFDYAFGFLCCVSGLQQHTQNTAISFTLDFLSFDKDGRGRRRAFVDGYIMEEMKRSNRKAEAETMEKREYQSGQSEMS